jgi:hypothetical protein
VLSINLRNAHSVLRCPLQDIHSGRHRQKRLLQ